MVRGYKVERITKLAKIHTRHVSIVQLFRENVCVEDDIYNQIPNKASQAWKKGSPGSCRAGGGGHHLEELGPGKRYSALPLNFEQNNKFSHFSV